MFYSKQSLILTVERISIKFTRWRIFEYQICNYRDFISFGILAEFQGQVFCCKLGFLLQKFFGAQAKYFSVRAVQPEEKKNSKLAAAFRTLATQYIKKYQSCNWANMSNVYCRSLSQ